MSTAQNLIDAIRAEARQDALNEAWTIVNAEGGTYSQEVREERYADGHSTALKDSLAALERAGARDPAPDAAALRRRIAALEAQINLQMAHAA